MPPRAYFRTSIRSGLGAQGSGHLPRAPRPQPRASRGVLLVEAVLSAVVIAVGLTFITRALGSQLKALQRVEEYAVLMDLAQQTLRTRDVDVQAGRQPRGPREGTFQEPYTAYQWTLSAAALENPDISRVTLSVSRTDRATSYTVRVVWPTTLVPPDWFSS